MIRFTILGQPCSKANSRRLVKFGDRIVPIKSKEALDYERSARLQIPAHAKQMLEGPVCVTLRLYYSSERPDLDESIVLDVMQARFDGRGKDRRVIHKGVFGNDRQVRQKHVYHYIVKANPRAEIEVEPLVEQLPVVAVQVFQVPIQSIKPF